MILKREVIEQGGKMPELYFLYYEELDWCSIITRAGYKLRFEPSCTIFHKESRTTGMHSPLRTYYLTRNRMLYAWRNCNASDRYLSIIYQSFIVMPRDIVFSLIKCRFDISRAVLRGWKAFFKISNKQS